MAVDRCAFGTRALGCGVGAPGAMARTLDVIGRRATSGVRALLLACGAVAFYSWGLGFYGQGVYLPALHTLHGWPTSLMSAAITC